MIRVGQKLFEERSRRGLSLDDVSRATKIRASFLSAIEKGEYHKLPSSAYAHGFVRNYAAFLGLPKREMLALFRREFGHESDIKVLPEGFSNNNSFFFRGIRVYQTFFVVLGVFAVLLVYILFQYRYVFINPPLSVSSPKEGSIVDNEDITVIGKTDPNVIVSVNNESVLVNNKGEFMKKITAFFGKTIIVIKAKSRLGRETTVERQVEVK